MSGRFAGQTALVTGAGHGIGAATALRFASEGAAVVVADLESDAAASVSARIASGNGRAIAQPCDVTQRASVEALVQRAVSEFRAAGVRIGRLPFTRREAERIAAHSIVQVAHLLAHGTPLWSAEIGEGPA